MISNKLNELAEFKDNWDGEGAFAPNTIALNSAKNIVQWLFENNIEISEIDADVLGGIAILCNDKNQMSHWFACMNSGNTTVVSWKKTLKLSQSLKFNTPEERNLWLKQHLKNN